MPAPLDDIRELGNTASCGDWWSSIAGSENRPCALWLPRSMDLNLGGGSEDGLHCVFPGQIEGAHDACALQIAIRQANGVTDGVQLMLAFLRRHGAFQQIRQARPWCRVCLAGSSQTSTGSSMRWPIASMYASTAMLRNLRPAGAVVLNHSAWVLPKCIPERRPGRQHRPRTCSFEPSATPLHILVLLRFQFSPLALKQYLSTLNCFPLAVASVQVKAASEPNHAYPAYRVGSDPTLTRRGVKPASQLRKNQACFPIHSPIHKNSGLVRLRWF